MRICLRRREFIAALGGAAAWPLAARAGDRVRRIGVLMAGVERPLSNLWYPDAAAFMQALAGLGWTDGHNMRLDVRWWGDDINRIPAIARSWSVCNPTSS